jgi:valyl-tRNA synthetase
MKSPSRRQLAQEKAAMSDKSALPPRYDPKPVEQKWYRAWESGGCFEAPLNDSPEHYSIVIPPPNITGELHMGHALNNTIQDIYIRLNRMRGIDTLWLPGTDHASIATENVVKRSLEEEGTSKRELGREKFIERVWEWREKYGSRIIEQLKRLGSSCDWSRTRFTMDEGLSRAVRTVFVELFNKKLIYRGSYLVNWCTKCGTALSDDEVEHHDLHGKLWWIRYPVKDSGESVEVATTRPETMLGDTAVAVNPEDGRYRGLLKKKVVLPLLGRELRVIEDDFVSREFGSGVVKVTPAHDANDAAMGERHRLDFINILNPDGTLNENAGPYAGLGVYEAREKVVEDLEKQGLLVKVEDYDTSIGRCYRCNTIVEPYISTQWFVRMKALAEPAAQVVREDKVRFYPARWKDFYLSWLDNVRDWCISRQLWWGHRIPAYYCDDCGGEPFASVEEPGKCPHCESTNIRQDEDVLDTWFSSALWPFSTMGWPEHAPLLKKYYPTDVLVTDRGIIFFWVARMVMMGLEFMGEAPFRDVYIHGTILDELGRKMSKSLGNGIDPLIMIEGGVQRYLDEDYECDGFGADAVRFSLISLSAEGQDLKLSPTRFEMGRNFCNKLWNAARFSLMNLEGFQPGALEKQSLALEDRWILSRLNSVVREYTAALDNYRLHEAANTIYHFTWHEFCDWYLELIKPRIAAGGSDKTTAQRVLANVLEDILALLHPIMPFITEELYSHLNGITGGGRTLIVRAFPQSDEEWIDRKYEEMIPFLQDIVKGIRETATTLGISKESGYKVVLSTQTEKPRKSIDENIAFVKRLTQVAEIEVGIDLPKPPYASTAMATFTVGGHSEVVKIYPSLEGFKDVLDKEAARLEKELRKIEQALEGTEKKLANRQFLEKAPADVVEQTKARQAELTEKISKLKESLESLK